MLISGPITQADEQLFRFLNQSGSNVFLDGIFVFFTIVGFSYVMILLAIPIWLRGKKELAFDLVVLIILATILSEIMKFAVDRPRPVETLADVNTILSSSGPSFPSGHATRAFALAALLWLNLRWKEGVGATCLAFMIALSRVYLGVHWPSDVIAGAILGVATATAVQYVGKASVWYRQLRTFFLGRRQSFRRSGQT